MVNQILITILLVCSSGFVRAAHMLPSSQSVVKSQSDLTSAAQLSATSGPNVASNVIQSSSPKQQQAESSGEIAQQSKATHKQQQASSDNEKLKQGIRSFFRKSSPGNFFVPSVKKEAGGQQQQPQQQVQLADKQSQSQQSNSQAQQQQQQTGSQSSGEPSPKIVGVETSGDAIIGGQGRLKSNGSLFRWGR